MKILFTGASSFTGYWFVKEFASLGHEVFATFRAPLESYRGIRLERINRLLPICTPLFETSFGSARFLHCLENHSFDVFCHHASQVENYKSDDFDVLDALKNNTFQIRDVISLLVRQGCRSLVVSGSIFEKGEGESGSSNGSLSPYGLSKYLTNEFIAFEAGRQGLPMGKFVIANPFGPYEEERFTTWLMKNWFEGKKPQVRTPDYTRDNIHVSLLAKAYVQFALQKPPAQFYKLNPSGYVSTQRAFTEKFSEKMQKYLQLPCEFEAARQTQFPEPKMLYHTDPIDQGDWNEENAWKELADYYAGRYAAGAL